MSKSDIVNNPQTKDKKSRVKHRHVVTVAPSSQPKLHTKSASELPPKPKSNGRSMSTQRENWRSRTSDPKTKDVAELRNQLDDDRDARGNLVITINPGGSAATATTTSSTTTTATSTAERQLQHSSLNKLKAHRQLRAAAANATGDQHILGDILIHASSWNQLTARYYSAQHQHYHQHQKQQQQHAHHNHHHHHRKILGVGWKSVYCTLDTEKLQFYDTQYELENSTTAAATAAAMANDSSSSSSSPLSLVEDAVTSTTTAAQLTIYVSEILSVNKSIRAIDGEKCVLELNVCGEKCLLSFAEKEQQTYWHSVLQDQHFSYFIWRSIPMDAQQRRSQSVLHAVYKALNTHHSPAAIASASYRDLDSLSKEYDAFTTNALYIEEILQKIASLNIGKIIELVPVECRFMSGRLVRVITSIRTFFISALKSVSGADIPLPSTQCLLHYLDEMTHVEWQHTNIALLDFYCDRCYRLLMTLSFALTANARDEILKSNAYRTPSTKRGGGGGGGRRRTHARYKQQEENEDDGEEDPEDENPDESENDAAAHIAGMDMERRLAEMKFEYESLQRSWRMHRDRLQEYVMAYRDAVAKLKASYHQRDNLCKKIEGLLSDKKQLTESIQLQRKNHDSMMQQAQELAAKFSMVSQQMHNNNNNNMNMNGMASPIAAAAAAAAAASPTSSNNNNNNNGGSMTMQYNTSAQFSSPASYGHAHATMAPPQNQMTHNQFGYVRQTSPPPPPFYAQPGSISNDGGMFTPYNQMQQLSQEMSNLFNTNLLPRQSSNGNTQFAWM